MDSPSGVETEGASCDHYSLEEPIARASRVMTLPKLQRKLLVAMARAFGSDDTRAAPVPTISEQEQLKVERYVRMMDHFQLRHVPSSVVVGSCTARSPRPLSRRHSSGTETVRQQAQRLSASVHGSADADAPESLPPPVPHLATSQHVKNTRSNVWAWRPFSPTGKCTRIRLLLLSLALVIQLVYMPYGVAYYPRYHSKTIAIDTLIDMAYILNTLAVANTEVNTGRGPPISSRRAIWRHYRKRGLYMDALAMFPVEMLLYILPIPLWVATIVRMAHLAIQYLSLARHVNRFHRSWKHEVMRTDKSVIAWMLYSRYSHLVRIGVIVCLVMVMAHYFACVWSLLQADVDPTFLLSRDPLEIHIRSIYDSLQLLQGQGLPTTTPLQDLFGSIAVLLGSIALAVIFGHVAILVSNFSANQTSYQRKMERVFAIMGKLQLPHPIRERVHQYYKYLHHTLELEVVLFKYMDVVMHVPHWRECSPDFQKQLVLNLSVRVYLPDDFIMRRGEVGTECYIINRGTCKQHTYATGNYEPPTPPMVSDKSEDARRSHGRRSSFAVSETSTASMRCEKQTVHPQANYLVLESGRSDTNALDDGSCARITVLKRGQILGDMALISNYERSSDVRAVSYVEMCVLERDTFQRILMRYRNDREIVLTSIVCHTMHHLATEHMSCDLMQVVQQVQPGATVSAGIELIASAINPRGSDPSIVFGMTEDLASRLRDAIGGAADSTPPDLPTPMATSTPVPDPSENDIHLPTTENELVRLMREVQTQLTQTHDRLARIEERLFMTSRSVSPRKPSAKSSPQSISSRSLCKQPRAHTAKPGELYPASGSPTSVNAHLRCAPASSKRTLHDLAGTLWSRSMGVTATRSPSPCADELYRSRRPSAGVSPNQELDRPSLVRTNSS